MKVAVTGAGGFLGSRLAAALLAPACALRVTELLLVDLAAPAPPAARVRSLALDLAAPGAVDRVVEPDTAVVFHLAAVVSGGAERDFDLGMRVNFDATRALMEAARRRAPGLVFVMTSTVAVYGGELPPAPDEDVAPRPQTSYGCAKAMAELLARAVPAGADGRRARDAGGAGARVRGALRGARELRAGRGGGK